MRARSESGKFLRRWSDDDLRRAAAASDTLAATIRELGLSTSRSSYALVRARITELALDTAHWKPPRRPSGQAREPRKRFSHCAVAAGGVIASKARPEKVESGRRLAEAIRSGLNVFEALELSPAATDDLIEHLSRVPLLPEWDLDVVAASSPILGTSKVRRRLTKKQARVLTMYGRGMTASEIAESLGISEHGVQHHVRSAKWALGAKTRNEAIAKAVAARLIEVTAELPPSDHARRIGHRAVRVAPEGPVATKPPGSPAAWAVLEPLSCGLENSEIGVELGLSEETVKSHVSALLTEFGCRNRLELAIRYVRGEIP